MKLGASDYILTSNGQAVHDCLSEVKKSIGKVKQSSFAQTQIQATKKLKELVSNSQSIKDSIKSIQLNMSSESQLVVLVGDPHVGKESIAKAVIYDEAVSYTHLTLPTICSV